MLKKVALAAVLLSLSLSGAWAADSLQKRAQGMFEALPQNPPSLEKNPLTPQMIELGRMLYFDPRLSASQLISCQTCHNVGLAGVDLQETSVGHGWQKGPRNAPTVLNAVFNRAQFWDGRADDLAEQAKGPVQASVEMNNTPDRVLETLNSIVGYIEMFRKAFPADKAPVSFDNMARAIEAFEATLITPGAPFDKYLKGDADALSKQQLQGLQLYMDKGCGACHSGVNLGGQGYYPFGLVEKPGAEVLPPDDLGRFKVTNTAADRYVFRAPPLRNITLTPPYFHSGKVWSLNDAVALMGSAQLGISLEAKEVEAIVAFLESLTGVQPRVEHPVLPPGGPSTPRPLLATGAAPAGH